MLSKNINYPIALILETSSIEPSKNDRQLPHCVKCQSYINEDIIIVPRIYYCGDAKMMLPNYQYLVIAYFQHSKGKENFHNLNIFINHPSQVALLTGEEITIGD